MSEQHRAWQEEADRAREAERQGAHHLAVLHLVRARFLAGSLEGDIPPGRPVRCALRSRPLPPGQEPLAFLASFAPAPEVWCYLLKEGVSRLARDNRWGDFEGPPRGTRLLEERQWLIISRPGEVLVADDRSTNLSIVLPASMPPFPDQGDPRLGAEPYSYATVLESKRPGCVSLDWAGDSVQALEEGDVLLTAYAAFVFGWLRPREA